MSVKLFTAVLNKKVARTGEQSGKEVNRAERLKYKKESEKFPKTVKDGL